MRTAILNYMLDHKLLLKPLTVTEHLPWSDNGAPLYHHNKKHLYVDLDQVTQNPVIDTLNSSGIIDEITIVRVYFVTDAKQPISNFESLINIIKDARLTSDISGVIQRTCQVSNTYDNDAVTSTFEFSFRKLIPNT
jgi:hypothetical protein